MTQIQNSLKKLTSSVENLEASLELIEEAIANDKSGNESKKSFVANGSNVDVAKKLDQAISHVEALLGNQVSDG